MSAPKTKGPFVVRWPHEPGFVPFPEAHEDRDAEAPWLEDSRDGTYVWADVHDHHQPEDMCLGRDLNDFVDALNIEANQRDALKATVKTLLAELESIRAYCAHKDRLDPDAENALTMGEWFVDATAKNIADAHKVIDDIEATWLWREPRGGDL